jgi:hypothetical protein
VEGNGEDLAEFGIQLMVDWLMVCWWRIDAFQTN